MLEFFRKYQRYFFILVAIVIVISFSFFGTQSAINSSNKVKDECIGQLIDGSKLMQSDLDQMSRFIASDRNDLALIEKGVMPNFFNDGVIRKDLLGTGVGILLVNAYFDDLKEELEERMVSHKGYRPYCHPTAPFISVENLWAQVLPSQKGNLDRFLHEIKEMNPDTYSLLVDLYLGETAFPSNILREYLVFQEKHYDWIQPDPHLARANLNLFKCKSIEDWFGPRFTHLTAQFILNAGAVAKEQGYKVTYEEAKVDLIRNGYVALQTQKRKGEISEEEIGSLWRNQLLSLGMNEKQAVKVWQKVMLFRRLFEDVGGSVFVDPHIYQTFYGFASKTAEVDLYHLPSSLELKDFSSLMKLELYLDRVAQNRKEGLLLAQNFLSAEEIEKTCPELIEQRFLVEVAEVKIDDIALNVSLKEMWEWQLEKENYEFLEKEFPSLKVKRGENGEEYFACLEGLSPDVREKLDRLSRKKIVEEHPEWITDALNQAHMNTREISFSPNGKTLPFEGMETGEKLASLFAKAPTKGELEVDPKALEAKGKLEQFTGDKEIYYRFHVADRDLAKKVLTFREANERGILDTLLEKHLEKSYVEVQKKNPALFKTEESKWKPLREVKNEVGRILYSKILKNIEMEVSRFGVELPQDRFENLDGFYPKYRYLSYMHTAERDIRKMGEKSRFLVSPSLEKEEGKLEKKGELSAQWSLIKKNMMFKNHEKSPWFTSDIFAMVEKSWSDVAPRSNGSLAFFQLKEKSVPSGNFSNEMKQGQAILSKEAERYLMTDLIEKFKEKEVIQFYHDSPERT